LAEEETTSSSYLYKGKILNLRIDQILCQDGRPGIREIIEHEECIAVIPVDNRGNILLVIQYRKAIEKYLLEIPAGGIEKGEDPETAARRELQEEIGYLPGKLQKLGGFYSSPGFCNEYLHLFLADKLQPSRLIAEDTGNITVIEVSPVKIKPMIASGEICDAKTVAGLLYYLSNTGL
jgi:ADP-ribose pyrophosphatase